MQVNKISEESAGSDGRATDRYSRGVFSHHVATEFERLQLLESVLDPFTRHQLGEIGVGPGQSVLEVGAGAGSVARWMAHQGACVVAVDLDTTLLAKTLTDEPNVRVMTHDIGKDCFPEKSFDVIHARYVLVHVEDREEAVSRLVSWLTPGGFLLLEEPAFFPIDNSVHAEYRTVMQAFRNYSEEHIGTDTEWAKTLPGVFAKAGLVDIHSDARIQTIRGGDAESTWWRLTLGQARAQIIARGGLTDAEFDQGYAMLADPDFRDLSLAVFTAWGRSGTAAEDSMSGNRAPATRWPASGR